MCQVPATDIMALHTEKSANRLEVKKLLLIFLQALLFEEVCVSVYYQESAGTLLILLQLFLVLESSRPNR